MGRNNLTHATNTCSRYSQRHQHPSHHVNSRRPTCTESENECATDVVCARVYVARVLVVLSHATHTKILK
jgi:hypothetical protein